MDCIKIMAVFQPFEFGKNLKQAGAELGQAQLYWCIGQVASCIGVLVK